MKPPVVLACAALAALAACDPPAGGGDIPFDAPPLPVDARGAGPFTLTLLQGVGDPAPGQPAAGRGAILLGPDGVERELIVGDDGHATAEIAPGTAVFVVRSLGNMPELTVFTDVAPGMHVVAGGAPAPAPFPHIQGFTNVTVQRPFNAFGGVDVFLPCGQRVFDPFDLFQMPVYRCAGSERATVVVVAYADSGNPFVIGYDVATDVDLVAAVDGALTFDATTPPPRAQLSYTSLPSDLLSMSAAFAFTDGSTEVVTTTPAALVSGPTHRLDVPVVPLGTRTALRTHIQSSATAMAPVAHLRRYDDVRLAAAFDLGATITPFVSRPAFDTRSRTIAWTYLGGGGRRPDLVTTVASYFTPIGGQVRIVVHAPGARTSMPLSFPASLEPIAPSPADSFPQLEQVWAVELVGGDHADAVRAIDGELRRSLESIHAFADHDEVWISGSHL